MAWLYVVVLCFQDVGPGPAVVVPGRTHCVRKVGGNRVALWHGFMWLSCFQVVGPGPAVAVPDSTHCCRKVGGNRTLWHGFRWLSCVFRMWGPAQLWLYQAQPIAFGRLVAIGWPCGMALCGCLVYRVWVPAQLWLYLTPPSTGGGRWSVTGRGMRSERRRLTNPQSSAPSSTPQVPTYPPT